MVSHRVIYDIRYDIRYPRQEEALWLAQSPGDFRRWADERDPVDRGVGP